MDTKRITRNAIMAVGQVILAGLILFLLYHYLLSTIGVEQVGIWAIVLATTSASRIGEMGFSASAVKYAAKYIANGNKQLASEVIETSVVTIGIISVLLLVVSYPVIIWFLGEIITSTNLATAISILPYALISAWLGVVGGVFSSGLDGCQRIDLRVLVSMLSNFLLLILVWLLVPKFGLAGLAWAQIGQGGLTLILNYILLRREIPELPIFSFKWRYSIFQEMFRYGYNFQIISIFSILFDPITKALMAKFGGLTSAAYYEMASRMVMQFRSLLISANQVIVPQIANIIETAPKQIPNIYLNSYRIIFYLSLPMYVGIAAISPLISQVWIGHYELFFINCTLFLALGYWVNSLTAPAYFINLGTGSLRFSTASHIVIGILNGLFGYGLGSIFGGFGVLLGYILSLIIGSSLITIGFHYDQRLSFRNLIPNGFGYFIVLCIIALVTSWGVFHYFTKIIDPMHNAVFTFISCITPLSLALWINPIRRKFLLNIRAASKS